MYREQGMQRLEDSTDIWPLWRTESIREDKTQSRSSPKGPCAKESGSGEPWMGLSNGLA